MISMICYVNGRPESHEARGKHQCVMITRSVLDFTSGVSHGISLGMAGQMFTYVDCAERDHDLAV